MRLGVVVATLNEEAELPATLDAVLAQAPDDVVVADGGSRDGTRRAAEGRARWLSCAAGRARQLNAGAAALGGADALLFLHADCVLGPGSLAAIREAVEDPRVVGGGFHKRFRSNDPMLRWGVRSRTRLWHAFGYVFGDQAQFVRASVFQRLGGFREDVIAEDMDLAWRMAFEGRVVLLDPPVDVSARRLEKHGVLTTWSRWWSVALAQGLRASFDGRRRGALEEPSISSEPRASRGSSGTE